MRRSPRCRLVSMEIGMHVEVVDGYALVNTTLQLTVIETPGEA